MIEDKNQLKKGDLVLVQPMRYCYSFVEGDINNLNQTGAPNQTTHHWTEDGFKARILSFTTLRTPCDRGENVEEYLEIKIFGRGRKHFVKRNGEKTKVIWIQQRLVSRCEKEDNKKK